MKKLIWMATFVLLAVTAVAQQRLKVYISADMEGIGGVVTSLQTGAQGHEYEKFRRLMTLEVNAAIAGAFEAGATEVLVSDSHGSEQNIDVELLDRRARLVRGRPRALGMMQGIDESFGAVGFVGYHASEGSPDGVLSHTFNGKVTVALNGTPVPEAGFNAAIAGEFGVPVVFISGDQAIAAEAERLLGPLETAVVKQATGFDAAITVHPEESQRMIRQGMKRGVERRTAIKPFRLSHPIKLQFTMKDVAEAELLSFLPGVERPQGNSVVFTARDMIEASRFTQGAINRR
jgi:D-amino peptidase